MTFKVGDRVRLVAPHTIWSSPASDSWLEIGDTGIVVDRGESFDPDGTARVAWDRPDPSQSTDNDPANQDLAWADTHCLAYAVPAPVHDLEALDAWLNS